MNLAKRKMEGELQTLHADLDEMLNEAKNSEEKAKKAMVDAARLADELRAEQEHAQAQEKMKKSLEVLLHFFLSLGVFLFSSQFIGQAGGINHCFLSLFFGVLGFVEHLVKISMQSLKFSLELPLSKSK